MSNKTEKYLGRYYMVIYTHKDGSIDTFTSSYENCVKTVADLESNNNFNYRVISSESTIDVTMLLLNTNHLKAITFK